MLSMEKTTNSPIRFSLNSVKVRPTHQEIRFVDGKNVSSYSSNVVFSGYISDKRVTEETNNGYYFQCIYHQANNKSAETKDRKNIILSTTIFSDRQKELEDRSNLNGVEIDLVSLTKPKKLITFRLDAPKKHYVIDGNEEKFLDYVYFINQYVMGDTSLMTYFV